MHRIQRVIVFIIAVMVALVVHADTEPLDRIVAVVNDHAISQSELNEELHIILSQAQQAQIELPDRKELIKQVLEQLINLRLQEQLAERWQITISDAEVDQAISNIAHYNQLSTEEMKEALVQEGIDFNYYRTQLKRRLLINRLQQQAIRPHISITEQEIEHYRQLMTNQDVYTQEFLVENILVALPDAPTTEQVKAAEQKANSLLESIKKGKDFRQVAMLESDDQFALQGGVLNWRKLAQLPEIFAEAIQSMQKGEVRGPIRAGNGFHLIHLVDVRGGKQKQYVDEYHIRQIFLKKDSLVSDDLLKLQLEDITKQLEKGLSFVELVEIYSQDPVSASHQGDLGWLKSFELPPELRLAVEKLEPSQVSPPIRTAAGWHLIQLVDKRQVDYTKEAQLAEIKDMIYQRKFEEYLQSWLQQLRSTAYIKILITI